MGAAFLLMAAITLAFIGTVTFDSHDPPSSARPAASTAKENSDDDAALNLASGEAVFLITVAAGALARSCSKRSGHRLVTYR